MEIEELKAKAYDTLIQIERLQQNLSKLNQMIGQEVSKDKEGNKKNRKAVN